MHCHLQKKFDKNYSFSNFAISSSANAIEVAICCFGVKNFNETKLNFLKISGVTGLDLLFDADQAGEAGAEHVKKLTNNFPVRVIKLRSGDPGSLVQKQVTGLRRKLYG